MTLAKYLICMGAGTLVSWGAWMLLMWRINPTEAGILGILFFYLTLLAALTGTFALLGFFGRKLVIRHEIDFRHVAISFRQAILFSALIVGALFLQSKDLFTWWNLVFLTIAFTLLEFFFISYKRS